MVISENASEAQITEMRKVFFSGAKHLFASIMTMLDPGTEVSEKDLDRMTLISQELEEFYKEIKETTGH